MARSIRKLSGKSCNEDERFLPECCLVLVHDSQMSSADEVPWFISGAFLQMSILLVHTAALLQRGRCLLPSNKTELVIGLAVCRLQ